MSNKNKELADLERKFCRLIRKQIAGRDNCTIVMQTAPNRRQQGIMESFGLVWAVDPNCPPDVWFAMDDYEPGDFDGRSEGGPDVDAGEVEGT